MFYKFLNIHIAAMPFILLTMLNQLSLALCVSKLPHTRLLAVSLFCLK